MSLFNITLKNIKNKKIIDEFVKYYEYIYYNQDSFDNTPKEIYYKLLNVKRVIGILSNYKNEITMDELEKLKNVKFIGDKSILRIKEILLKGFLSEIIQLKEKQKSIDELTKIYSISAKKANELYKKGIKTIDDLKKYDKITDQQRISLKYYDKLTDKIPKAVMKKFDTYLQKTLHKYDPNLIGVLCGSYRRGKDFSSDMDILITHSDLKNKNDCKKYADIVVMLLKNYLLDILTVGYNHRLQRIGKVQALLALVPFAHRPFLGHERVLDGAAYHDHTSRTTPGVQLELRFDGVISLADILPVLARPVPLNQALDARCLAQLEQIPLVHLFQFSHDRLVAKGIVATHQSRTLVRRQRLDDDNQARQTVFGRMSLAPLHLGIKHQPYVGDPVSVDGMTGPPRLGRVVADFCAILMAVEQFDRRVAVKYPLGVQGFVSAFFQCVIHPRSRLGQLGFAPDALFVRAAFISARRQMFQRTAQTFVADDPAHAQYLRRHRVPTQSGDVRIAPLAIKNREQPGAKYLAYRRRIGAGVGHRATFDPALKHPRYLQKLGEEWQLAQRRSTAVLIPANLEPASGCGDAHLGPLSGLFGKRPINNFYHCISLKICLTHQVSLPIGLKPTSALSLRQFRGAQLSKIG